MSVISGSTAAFYQFFRDRETATAPQQSDGSDGTRRNADAIEAGQTVPGQSADSAQLGPSGALTPTQVRDRLEALIAGQVATGKLTDVQATALRKSLGPDTSLAATDPKAAASPSSPDDRPSRGSVRPVEADGSYNPSEVLATFIQNLQSSQTRSASYGSTGAAPAGRTASRLLDFNT